MFHSITSILTTAAVALHAILGCCAHHAHSCEAQEPVLAVVHRAATDCSHGHHHHDESDQSESHHDGLSGGCNHQHNDDNHHDDCDESKCSFTSVQRTNDVEWLLTSSIWCQVLGDVADASALDGSLALGRLNRAPPDRLSKTGTDRSLSQVWRL